MTNKVDVQKFYNCFVNALGVELKDLDMKKTLIEDLGADSLDLLDLVYQIERSFNITIPRGEIEKTARARLQGEDFEIDGFVTDAGIESLKEELPDVDFNKYTGEKKLRVNDIPLLFTVGTFYRITEKQLEQDNSIILST